MRSCFVQANGLRLHYLEHGDVGAVPLVLLHGGSAHAHWWDFFAAAMNDSFRIIAADLRGHGDSGRPFPPAYRIADYVADLAALAGTLGLQRFHLAGHSLGGIIAAAYAGYAPQGLDSLVLIDAQARISPSGARYMSRLRHFPHPHYRDREHAIQRFRLLPSATNAHPEVLAHMAAHGIRETDDGRWTLKFDRETLAFAEPQDYTAALAQLTCPILLLRGAHSILLSRRALAVMKAAVPHADTLEIPDAHHHIMLDNPETFAEALRTFLLKTVASGK
jgi:pimeloyl-ACP methyl ester carboxylesterase